MMWILEDHETLMIGNPEFASGICLVLSIFALDKNAYIVCKTLFLT